MAKSPLSCLMPIFSTPTRVVPAVPLAAALILALATTLTACATSPTTDDAPLTDAEAAPAADAHGTSKPGFYLNETASDAHAADSQRLLDTVAAFLEQDEWTFSRDARLPLLRTSVRMKNTHLRTFIVADERNRQVLVYSVAPVMVPEDQRAFAAEFLTRANYGLQIGNFEMDFSDGEVRYKTSIDVEGGELTPVMIKNLIYINITVMDRYLPGLMSVLHGGTMPDEAIRSIEGPRR